MERLPVPSLCLAAKSVTYTKNFCDIGTIFCSLDETVGNVRAGNMESEKRQMPLLHALTPGKRLVCELGWTNNYAGKEQPSDQIGWRHNRIPEQEGR
jgi:hypothetical protein